MSTLCSKHIKPIVFKPLCVDFAINTYPLKVYTFEIDLQKLVTTKLDIKSRNVKKYRKWEW